MASSLGASGVVVVSQRVLLYLFAGIFQILFFFSSSFRANPVNKLARPGSAQLCQVSRKAQARLG
jgi:hypothetical protein